MSGFHSTMSRRDFMKGLGLTGATLGSAALVAPVFHDLDELASSEKANWKRPWWVKHLEAEKPTVEVDFSQMQRFDQRQTTQSQYTNAQYAGAAEWAKVAALGAKVTADNNGKKGNTAKDKSLQAAATYFYSAFIFSASTLTGPTKGIKTPEQNGLPKWTGTPEEGSKILRAASVFFGAGAIGSSALQKKLVFTHMKAGATDGRTANDATYISSWPPPDIVGPKIDFENVALGYETPERKVLPDSVQLHEVGVMIPMAKDAWRTALPGAPCGISSAANISRYRMWTCSVQPGIQAFLKGIGYVGYGYPYPDMSGGLVPAQASAVLGGISEMGRHSEAAISPEFGANMGYYSFLTDMPIADDNPIDAGIFRFCHACRVCADRCPSGSISQDSEPSWDVPQGYLVPNANQQKGKKLFWTDTHGCVKYKNAYGCTICRPVCTFNTNNAAIHQYVKQTVSTTPLFNGFFAKMHDPFGYGLKDPDGWWDLSLPIWGTDSTTVAYDGGYKK
jgi:epoxyqueuosine reductase